MATKPIPKAAVKHKSAAVEKRELSANKYIAIVIAVTIVITLVCGYIAKGLISGALQNTQLLLKKNQANHDLDTKLTNIPILVDNYNALGSKQALIKHALPDDPDFPALVTIAQNLSTSAGVSLRSVAPATADPATSTTTTAANGASTYQVTLSVAGAYPQVVQLFKNIEHSVRPMRVTGTQLTGQDNQLLASVTIETYYQGPAKIDDATEVLK